MLDADLPAFFLQRNCPQRKVKEPIQPRSAFSRDTVFPRLPRLPWCSPWRWASHPSRWRDGWPGSAGWLGSWLYGKHWKTQYHRWPISSSTYLMVFQHPAVVRVDFGVCWAPKSWHEVCEWLVHRMLIRNYSLKLRYKSLAFKKTGCSGELWPGSCKNPMFHRNP